MHSCGVSVPGIRIVDATEGVIGIEWIDGASVRAMLGGGADDDDAANFDEVGDPYIGSTGMDDKQDTLTEYGLTKRRPYF